MSPPAAIATMMRMTIIVPVQEPPGAMVSTFLSNLAEAPLLLAKVALFPETLTVWTTKSKKMDFPLGGGSVWLKSFPANPTAVQAVLLAQANLAVTLPPACVMTTEELG